MIDEVGVDSARAVSRKLEERAIKPGPDVEILVVADAGHERHAVEYAGGAEEEVVPVGALVAAVDQVSGEQDEIDRGMTAMSGGEQTSPALRDRSERRPGTRSSRRSSVGRGFHGSPRPPAGRVPSPRE